MKTIEELYKEVLASEELKKEFLALKPEKVEGFAAKYGCEAKFEEIKAFFEAKKTQNGELSDDDMDQVAGGKGGDRDEAIESVVTLGIGCALWALVSVIDGNAGTSIEGDHLLCET